MATVILHISEGGKTSTVQLDEGSVTLLGRATDCGVILSHTQISRYHCMLEVQDDEVMLRDFGSLNGTYLNGKLIGKRPAGMTAEQAKEMEHKDVHQIKDGDKLTLSKVCDIRLECKAEASQKKCMMCGKFIPAGNNRGLCSACVAKLAKNFDPPEVEPFAPPAKEPKAPEKKPAKLEPGDVIPGYKKVKVIGEGGMGTVYLVTERATGKTMALKTVRRDQARDKHSVAMFLREASVAQQLNHPNVAKQYATGEYKGMPYILMEYYPDGTLVDYWKKVRKSSKKYAHAAYILMQILWGLHYIHNTELTVTLADGTTQKVRGIVHRDLKPHNIFISLENNTVTLKLADFGLSKAYEVAGLSGFTMTNARMGTLAFMPRQQVINTKYSKPEVDVWAAAASVFYLLTDRPAKPLVPGQDPIRVILTENATPVAKCDKNVPAAFAKVLDKALKDNPSIGYQAAIELYNALKPVYAELNK